MSVEATQIETHRLRFAVAVTVIIFVAILAGVLVKWTFTVSDAAHSAKRATASSVASTRASNIQGCRAQYRSLTVDAADVVVRSKNADLETARSNLIDTQSAALQAIAENDKTAEAVAIAQLQPNRDSITAAAAAVKDATDSYGAATTRYQVDLTESVQHPRRFLTDCSGLFGRHPAN